MTVIKGVFLGYPYFKIGRWGVIRDVLVDTKYLSRNPLIQIPFSASVITYDNKFMWFAPEGFTQLWSIHKRKGSKKIPDYLPSKYYYDYYDKLTGSISPRKAISILTNASDNYVLSPDAAGDYNPEKILPKEVLDCLVSNFKYPIPLYKEFLRESNLKSIPTLTKHRQIKSKSKSPIMRRSSSYKPNYKGENHGVKNKGN